MYTDNWTVCPRCRELQQKEAQNPTLEQTLRENCVIGIYQDIFRVTYGARCTECGFSYKFEHKDTPVLPECKGMPLTQRNTKGKTK